MRPVVTLSTRVELSLAKVGGTVREPRVPLLQVCYRHAFE